MNKTKKVLLPLLTTGLVLGSAVAFGQTTDLDTTEVVAEIAALKTYIFAIGGAVLVLSAAVMAITWSKRVAR